MKNRYHKVKMAVILICVLAAGMCYSCSRGQSGWESEELLAAGPGQEDTRALIEAGAEKLPETGGETVKAPADSFQEMSEGDSEADIETASVCYVHICGEVTAPGVYEMEEGSRVFQVVDQAGGFTDQAASQYLNMAQTVSDGMKIVVPSADSLDEANRYGSNGIGNGIIDGDGTMSGSGGTSGSENAKTGAKVNLNTASKEELMTLRGIGEAKAEDIIAYRESHGRFQRIEDIMKISGIKNAAFMKIKDDITV